MNTHEDRENLLNGMLSLRSLCHKIARNSKHTQEVLWSRGPKRPTLTTTISWGLHFDDLNLVFKPIVFVMSTSLSRDSRILLELGKAIEERLVRLKEQEPWPDTIPDEWLHNGDNL